MTHSRKIVLLFLALLLAATVYGLIRTGPQTAIPLPTATENTPDQPLVDQTPLLTAQALAHAEISAVEMPFLQEALKIADREMDLSFAQAVLDATAHPPVLSAQAKDIQTRLHAAEDALAAEEAKVAQLTAAKEKATGAQKDILGDQLDLATARQELAQDEVDDAEQELVRAGGDPQARIRAMIREHEAASEASDTMKLSVTAPVETHSLIQRFGRWSALRDKQLQLLRAKQDAASMANALSAKRAALQQQIGAPSADRTAATNGASTPATGREESAAIVKSTQRLAADQRALGTVANRIDNEKQLTVIYGKWIDVVAAEQRVVVAGGLRGVLVILAIAILGLFVGGWIESLLGKVSKDARQVDTLRRVMRIALQIIGVLLIMLVIFGPPGQLGTFLGLAGAGLTIALKDFIVSFIGWIVLMGKNGIRLGDWVEINEVTGEVVELGMFHTVLLETGNWTDPGHPTGRRVTFTNSFAIEGHYFNFSTSGQWLWDELQIILPAGTNPYPIVEAIQKIVMDVTSESARQAEQEWQRAVKSRATKPISAAPAINVRPVTGGTEISVRYVTRANERAQLRAKLNQAAVDLLGPEFAPQSPADSPANSPVNSPVNSSTLTPTSR